MNQFKRYCLVAPWLVGSVAASLADPADDAARDQLQRQLNQEVLAAPFNSGDIQKAEAFARDAKRNNVPPVMQAPSDWSPGWTCGHLTAYRYYNDADYRNCVYYHHYHGHYWR